MDSGRAVAIAEASRPAHGIPEDARAGRLERRWIELAGLDPETPAPVADVLAWVVRLQRGVAWIDVAVDDATGEVVRVEWSRAALSRVTGTVAP